MKLNLPVTGNENIYPENKTLVSKTDTKGIITFANSDFVEVSGYNEKELIGANHNLIRHPDVPPVIFEVMWKTLKRGKPWSGIVKNRCKNGDHYWVDAKVVPIKKNGQIVGYMSVRTCPSRADVADAEAQYRLAAEQPETIKETAPADWMKHLSIRNGIPLWILFVTLMMIAGGILGITGLNMSNQAIQSLYTDEMEPVEAIGRINFLMADNRAQVALTLHHNPLTHPDIKHDHDVSLHMKTLVRNKEEIDRLWAGYASRIILPEEKALADDYWQARNRYVQEGLLQSRQAIEAGDYARTETLLFETVTPLYDKANAKVFILLKHLSDRGQVKFATMAEHNRMISTIAIAGITGSCFILVICGVFFFRVTVMPLQRSVEALEKIAEGNLSGEVDTHGFGEPGRVIAAVQIMQMHLKVMMHEIQQSATSIRRQCRSLNATMMNLAEHSDEQHDRVYQTIDAIGQACNGLHGVANNAEALLHPTGQSGAAIGIQQAEEVLAQMPTELLAIFGDSPALSPASQPVVVSDSVPAESGSSTAGSVDGNRDQHVLELASAARVQVLVVEDAASQLNLVAGLIVENREDVQSAWVASQHLEQTAKELDKLVKYFE